MRIPTLGETELLIPLHEGMFEQPMWHTFLDRLKGETGADNAAFMLTPRDGSERIGFSSGATHDLRDISLPDFREGRVYTQAELSEDPIGDMRVIRWSDDTMVDCRLVLTGDGLASPTGSLLTALLPHLRTATRIFSTLEIARTRTRVKEEAFRRMNFGWILLDARCRIIDHDPQAGDNLDRAGLLKRGPYDRLIAASPSADRELTRQVADCAADRDTRPRTINLCRDPWVDILVAPSHVRTLVGSGEAVAAVYLRGDRQSSADRHEQLVDLFQLTPSEARLAWTMAQGLSIAEAAAEHGLTVETARNYSKKIYAKTGARGQADLVRHVLTSLLALA